MAGISSQTDAFGAARRVHEVAVTSAANAGADTTLATVAGGSVIVTGVIVFAVATQTGDMTNAAVQGGAGKIITFIAAADCLQADLDAEDEQVYWTGAVRLNTGDTIVMVHAGTNTGALDLVVAITYHPSSTIGAYLS